jgi:hypothetical protein
MRLDALIAVAFWWLVIRCLIVDVRQMRRTWPAIHARTRLFWRRLQHQWAVFRHAIK